MFAAWFRREFRSPRRLVFNLSFYGTQLVLFALGWRLQETDERLVALNALTWSAWTSRGAGLTLALDAGLLLVPTLRNVITVLRPKLVRLFPADENIWFHRQVAYSMAFWTVVHATAHYINFFNIELTQTRTGTAIDIHYTQAGGITGHAMLLIMLLIYTTAHHKIRHESFEAFWYTHHLAFFFFISLYSHATGCFVRDSVNPDLIPTFPFYSDRHCLGYESWRFIIWPGIAYLSERMYREYRARTTTKLSKVLVHPNGTMELHVIKPSFRYTAGQWVFIQVPEISHFQWHPFTITSAPEDPYVSLHIRQVGDWTRALGKRLGCEPPIVAAVPNASVRGTEADEVRRSGIRGGSVELEPAFARLLLQVRIDGPYGSPTEDVFDNDVALLIGAGIGVTPFASILKHIWYCQKNGNVGSLRRVEFFWVCREAASFGWFQSLLKEVEAVRSDSNFLRINIYLTQKADENMLWNIAINDGVAEYDPLTLLRTRTTFGRPDWTNVYRRIREAIETGQYLPCRTAHLKTKVGTYFCGPGALSKVIKEATFQHTTNDIEFTFTKEHM